VVVPPPVAFMVMMYFALAGTASSRATHRLRHSGAFARAEVFMVVITLLPPFG